jgi:hypothetical protein
MDPDFKALENKINDPEFWRERTWRTADGRSVKIKDMDLGHLVNVINWIADNSSAYPSSIYDVMVREANYRQLVLFAQGKPYPQKFAKNWQVVDPATGQGRIIPPPPEYIEETKDNEAYQRMSKRTQKLRQERTNS